MKWPLRASDFAAGLLDGNLSEWIEPYNEELQKVISTRLDELHGEDYMRVMKEENVVPLRMNPEPKKGGRKKMRLIVKGFLEPASWDDKIDSPTVMSSTIRQMVLSYWCPTQDSGWGPVPGYG